MAAERLGLSEQRVPLPVAELTVELLTGNALYYSETHIANKQYPKCTTLTVP